MANPLPVKDAGKNKSSVQFFEAALCSCIKESPAFQKNMQYNFGNYVCGSWIEDMWECARRRSQAWYGQLRNDKGVYPYMTREFNLY